MVIRMYVKWRDWKGYTCGLRRVKNRSDLIDVFKVIKRFFIVLDCG